MFIKKTPKKNGRVYLALAEGYRIDGKSRSKTIRSLGYLDELEKLYDDPIAHFEEECERENALKRKQYATQTITAHLAQKIDKRTENRKNIGCAIPLSYYNGLGIETTLRSHSRNRRFSYDVNAIMRLLVIERMIDPKSKYSAFENRGKYFFKSDFTDDDIYRSLDFFADKKDAIIAAMNRSIEKQGHRDMSHVFYDVTNHYFEIDESDEDVIDDTTGEVIEEGLRKKGVEKNRRRDPIVQMGLLQDSNALPITYRLFSGNTNDCTTLLPVLKDLKRDYKLERVIVVADKGLNTSTNIAANILDGNGYVFSQSIRGTKSAKEVRNWVISEAGYIENADGTFKVKSRLCDKTVHINYTDEDGTEKTKDVDIEIKMVAYWSEKYARRSRHKRAEAIEKAKRLIANPASYTKATSGGAARYVKNITFDKKTGEVLEDAGKHATLDEALIKEQEACDGYYCLITSETDLLDEKIIDIYKGLWRIEEAFKITKSDISTRPVYVRKAPHIEAHFLTCYIALTILRLIQKDLGFSHSVTKILENISAMSGTHEGSNLWLFDHRTDLSDLLSENVGIDLTRKRMRLSEIKSVLSQVNKRN